jgi:hypothetical protein
MRLSRLADKRVERRVRRDGAVITALPPIGGEVSMEAIIRVILMFFFIQFLVVITIMAVAMLSARQEVPVSGREPGQEVRGPSFAFVTHLASRVLRSGVRLVQSIHFHSVH